MASEAQAQKFVHNLEHGKGRWWVWFLVIIFIAAYQVMTFLAVNWLNFPGRQPTFQGLTHAKGMEQAVIARELARGNGFSTTVIKPAAIAFVEERNLGGGKKEEAFTNFLRPDGPTAGHIPDFYHAPLSPFINSFALRAALKLNEKTKWRANEEGKADYWGFQQAELVHPADKVLAGVAVFFFLCAIVVNFLLAKLLFDQRLAVLLVLILLLCDHFWKFAETGLPQMLMLFLFSLATYFYTRAIMASDEERLVWPWLIGVGLCMGLLALSHGLTLWMLCGLLPHSIFFFKRFGQFGAYPAIILACVAICYVPWMVRNTRVCGSATGLGWVAKNFQIRGSESQIMRTYLSPDKAVEPSNFRSKIQVQYLAQISQLNQHLGVGTIAPFFFLSLLHAYRRREVRAIRWGAMWMWGGALFGMCVFGFSDYDLEPRYQANDLHLLFIPIMLAYGLSLILNMWGRVVVQNRELANLPLFNGTFLFMLVTLNSLPLLNTYTDPPKVGIVFPPYYPPGLAKFNEWYSDRDIVCSDMPWATAWYADRKSLWLPLTLPDFNEFNSVFHFNGRITGLLLTPMTGYRGFLSDMGIGEYKEWRNFITRDQKTVTNFTLNVSHPIGVGGGYLYIVYSDRDRFNERGL